MRTKKRMKEDIIRLECRIEALEDRICPGGDHDWVTIDRGFDTHDGLTFYDWENRRCRRCGKETTRRE